MSGPYLGRPGRRPVHIPAVGGAFQGTREAGDLCLVAECGETFQHPDRSSFWVARGRRRVCGHCTRLVRRRAIRLLRMAEGDVDGW